MAAILASIRRGFGGVLRFSGRDTPGQFWPYAIFLFLLSQAIGFVLVIPPMMDAFGRILRFAAEHPDQVTRTTGPGDHSIQVLAPHPELMPDFSGIAQWHAILTPILVALLAAAVARRLHDRDRTGLWGLMPLPFAAAALALAPIVFEAFRRGGGADPRVFFALLANNILYLATVAFLIFLLVGKGSRGPNRFGPDPAAP
jgi:uncharacterized membrane protein YhaH (DUF805 family)